MTGRTLLAAWEAGAISVEKTGPSTSFTPSCIALLTAAAGPPGAALSRTTSEKSSPAASNTPISAACSKVRPTPAFWPESGNSKATLAPAGVVGSVKLGLGDGVVVTVGAAGCCWLGAFG